MTPNASWPRCQAHDVPSRSFYIRGAVILSVAYGSTKKLLKRMSEESGFQATRTGRKLCFLQVTTGVSHSSSGC